MFGKENKLTGLVEEVYSLDIQAKNQKIHENPNVPDESTQSRNT